MKVVKFRRLLRLYAFLFCAVDSGDLPEHVSINPYTYNLILSTSQRIIFMYRTVLWCLGFGFGILLTYLLLLFYTNKITVGKSTFYVVPIIRRRSFCCGRICFRIETSPYPYLTHQKWKQNLFIGYKIVSFHFVRLGKRVITFRLDFILSTQSFKYWCGCPAFGLHFRQIFLH